MYDVYTFGKRDTDMARIYRNIIVTLSGLALAATLAGCSTTASIENGEDLANSVNGNESIIFGKFRLVRNGSEAQISNGMFATQATLKIDNSGAEHGILGKVGKDGEFAWALEPGEYRVTSIGFDSRGEHMETDSGFTLTVPADRKAVYVGTITLEASVDYGYHATKGAVDDYAVADDCATDCARRLDALGLSEDDMTVSLFKEQYQLARTN